MYSRNQIEYEGVRIHPNQGVAQGSILSPTLFNIFSKDLLYKLEQETGLSRDCILMYADDLLIICEDQSKLELVIKVVKDWSAANSMILNKNKSGIIEFRPRRNKPSRNFQINDRSVNLCGLTLNPTLQLSQQIVNVSKKAKEIYSRICPFLYSAEAGTRKNL